MPTGLFDDIIGSKPQGKSSGLFDDLLTDEEASLPAGVTPQEARRVQMEGEMDAERIFPEQAEARSTFNKARHQFAGRAALDTVSVLEALKMLSVGDAPDPQAPAVRYKLFRLGMDDPRWMDPEFMRQNEGLINMGVDPVQAAIGSEAVSAWRQRKHDMDRLFDPIQEPLEEAGKAALEVAKATPGHKGVTELAGAAGSTVPTLLTALTGPASAAAVAGMQSAGGTKQEALDYYKSMGLPDYQAENLANQVARLSGMSTALVTAGTGKILGHQGVEGWARAVAVSAVARNHPVRHVLENVFKEAGSEFVEEFTDQALQSMFAKRAHRPDLTWSQAFHESVQAGILGAVSAGTISAPMATASLSRYTNSQLSKDAARMLDEELGRELPIPPEAQADRRVFRVPEVDAGPASQPVAEKAAEPAGPAPTPPIIKPPPPPPPSVDEQADLQRELAEMQVDDDEAPAPVPTPVVKPAQLELEKKPEPVTVPASDERAATVESSRQPDVGLPPAVDGGQPTAAPGEPAGQQPAVGTPEQQGGAGPGGGGKSQVGGRKRGGSPGASPGESDRASGRPSAEPGPVPQPPEPAGEAAAPPVAPEPAVDPSDQNFVIQPGETLAPSGAKSKARANFDAIALLRKLEAENRNATPEEKKVLARYVGWGALKELFDHAKAQYRDGHPNWEKQWSKLYDELRSTLTPAEYKAANKSILNAHFTSPEIVSGMWAAVRRLGFDGGSVLEPSAGIGHFFGLIPSEVAKRSTLFGVELDSVSAGILAKLYPKARSQQTGFETSRIPNNTMDLVIGNVPFAKEGPYDPRYPSLSLHNYFFARGLDLLKPGGMMVAITSSSTMDQPISREARELFSEKADLVGAIRLPNNAFKANAGTEVTTDILIFRKRDGTGFSGHPFRDTRSVATPDKRAVSINEYFATHPEMMLGDMTLEGTMYGPDQPALKARPGEDINAAMAAAVARLPEGVFGTQPTPMVFGSLGEQADKSAKEGQLVVKDGVPYVVRTGALEKPEWHADKTAVKQAVAYVNLRELAKDLVDAQFNPASSDDVVEARRVALNAAYDAYVKKHGALNARGTRFLEDDPEFPLVGALENVETISVERPIKSGKNAGKIRIAKEEKFSKAEILQKRTIFPRIAPTTAENPADAVSISLAYRNVVEPSYVAQLLGIAVPEARRRLLDGGLVFENPASGVLETPDNYLSGDVKSKLKAARMAAVDNETYQRNVEALEKVQPARVALADISFRLGSTWLPPVHVKQFIADTLDVDAAVTFEPVTGTWRVRPTRGEQGAKNTTTYGGEYAGHQLVEQALNLTSPVVYDIIKTSDGERRERNPQKTLAMQSKQAQLRELFERWARGKQDVSTDLENIYNENFNGTVLRKFDGPAWDTYPGASTSVRLRPHQKAVVTRNLQQSTLLAHGVGTGKTFVLITTAMEMKRLGLAKKPMMVVQNATLSQFAASFKRLYPSAKVLAPSERMRESDNRQRLLSQIATGDYDAVIVPQSWFNMIPDNGERVEGYTMRRIQEVQKAMIEAAHEDGDARSPRAADLQRAMDKLENRLLELKDRKVDNVLTFEQLGVDALLVDEAHAYKKLEFSSKMDNVKGLDRGASQRGFSMLMKARFVQERNSGKNVVFATGTPISNTLAEAWNMMRYLRPDVLERFQMEDFDAFAGLFGETVTNMEMGAGGQWKPVTRFAKFTNGPELIAAFHTVADVILPEDVKLENVPTLKNGRPTNVVVPQTKEVAEYVKYLRQQLDAFDAMSGKEKRDNSYIPLVVFGLAKKMSLDMRLIEPSAKDDPQNKLSAATARIKEVWERSSDVTGTQLVFADSYQSAPSKSEWLDAEAPVKNPYFGKSEFNLYHELKRKLVAAGIPESEIAVVTDFKKDAQRESLFKRVNDGKVRVLLGSTEKMGVGVNVQQKLVALHHLDAPPRPMDVEQRNGRILRQGNENAEVEIFTYGVENTLDAAMFQRLATKQKFINQVLRGDLQGRNFEDAANETSMTFEEQMAAFSGDPLTVEKVSLDNQLRQLSSLADSHARDKSKAKSDLAGWIEALPLLEADLVKQTAEREDLAVRFTGDVSVTIEGRLSAGKDAAPALDALFKKSIAAAEKALADGERSKADFTRELGLIDVNGKIVSLSVTVPTDYNTGRKSPTRDSYISWKFPKDYPRDVSTGSGFMTSLRTKLKEIAERPEGTAAKIESAKRNIVELTGYVQQPFEQAAELESLRARVSEVEAVLSQRSKEVKEAEARAKQALDSASPAAAEALERLKTPGGEVNFLGMGTAYNVIRDLAIVGADLVRRGYRTFSTWSRAMTQRFGGKVAAWLKAAWDRIQRIQLIQSLGLTPESAAHVARIEGQAGVEVAGVRPVNNGITDGFFQKIRRTSQRILYFGSPDLLRAKQTLDLTESYQAAAIREQSDRLLRMLTDDAYNARPGEFKLPRWMTLGAWATRLRKFKKLALPVAAHLNITGRDPAGNWIYTGFEMRAGLMGNRQFTVGNHSIGDTIMVSNPVTGVMEALVIGNHIDDGKRSGYQLIRRMAPDQQREIYDYYRNEFPELIWALDIYVDPDLAGVRFRANGIEIPVFNRFASAVQMAQGNPGFSPLDAYTPDVLVTRSLMGAVAGALGLRRGMRSPGRKYKTGRSRESGEVRDLFSGFNIRTFQAAQEDVRRQWFRAVMNQAVAIPRTGVPEGFIKVETGIEEVWNAIRRLRNWQGAAAFPETADRLMNDGSPEFAAFVGEAAQLRGRQVMLPRPLVDMLVRQYASQAEHGRLYRLGAWAVRTSTQLFLAHPKTYVANVLTNDMFAAEAAFRSATAGAFKLFGPNRPMGRRDLRAAGNILGGLALNRFRGLRELLHFADNTRFLRVVREVLPDSVFADATQLADVKVRYDDRPFDLLRRGEIGGAVLTSMQYGNIDVRAKQRLAYAYLKADAVTAAREAGHTGPALRAEVDRYMMNPPMEARTRAVAAASFEMLNYADSPEWLNRFSRNDFGRLVLPFPRFGYHFIAKQANRLSALRLFLGRVPRGERADALADLVTVATFGLGGGGLLLHSAVKAIFGGDDDDDEPRKYIGTSSVKFVDEDGTVKTRQLDRELVTANRVNLSYAFRALGLDSDSENDFWLRVRQYPPVVMAGAAVLAQSDARKFGVAHGIATYMQAVSDLGSDFFSIGMALKVPDKIVASLRSLETGKAERPFFDPYAARVPLTAYLTEQAMDSFIPGSRQADEVLWWLDPIERRKTESEQLDFHPGVWHAVRLSHWSGVADRLFTRLGGEETDLLPAGGIETVPLSPSEPQSLRRRMMRLEGMFSLGDPESASRLFVPHGQRPRIAFVPERNRQPVPVLTRLTSLGGFNVRPVPREQYDASLMPELK